jgi:hypothetical protein
VPADHHAPFQVSLSHEETKDVVGKTRAVLTAFSHGGVLIQVRTYSVYTGEREEQIQSRVIKLMRHMLKSSQAICF